MRRLRLLRLVHVLHTLCAVLALLLAAQPAHAQGRDRLSAPVCALVASRLACYTQRGVVQVSAQGQRVIDFAVSGDGEWTAYRTDEGMIRVAAVYGIANWLLDADALPPAALDFDAATLAWSSDGITIAYVTANGLRAAFPTPSGTPQFSDFADRQYVNLRFSPSGARLAAQDSIGGWTVFTVIGDNGTRQGLRRLSAYDVPADAAWLDDNSLIVAPAEGGLLRLNVIDAEARLDGLWQKPDGFYTRLSSSPEGSVLAMELAPNASSGPIVTVGADGVVSRFGTANIDARIAWAAPGRVMAYITSGTPILVDPRTGAEEALPVHRASRMAWAAPIALQAGSLALDADLYYLAPGVNEPQSIQVWRLAADGQSAPRQLTSLSGDVLDFAVSPDRLSLAVTVGGQLVSVPMPGTLDASTPTFGRRFTPTPAPPGLPDVPGSRILAQVRGQGGARPDWSSDGWLVTFVDGDGVYVVPAREQSPTQPTPVRLGSAQGGQYERALFSPDSRSVLVVRSEEAGQQFAVLPVVTDARLVANQPFEGVSAVWGLNALFSIRRREADWELVAADPSSAVTLARSPWPIRDAQPVGGGAPGAGGQAALFLRHVGWPDGPETVQLAATTGDPAQPDIRSLPFPLVGAQLSPGGRFAAGIERGSDGKIGQLVILDLQNGRKVAIRDAKTISALRWVR